MGGSYYLTRQKTNLCKQTAALTPFTAPIGAGGVWVPGHLHLRPLCNYIQLTYYFTQRAPKPGTLPRAGLFCISSSPAP